MSVLTYRPDIDGLRAVAVMAVLLFHLDFGILPGGFIGVDVFFVISGFLITSIILRELQDGTFTLAGFYERRIRRILPAAFVVLTATLIAGYFLLLPTHYETLAFSSMMSVLYVSNMYFWKKEDYFQVQPEEQPLLHTWSLSVEEQFYILFPVFIILAVRFLGRDGAFWLLLVCALGSLALAEFAVQRNSLSFAFYLLPSRAWELAAGSLLAFHRLPKPERAALANILSIAGLVLIVGSALLLSKETPFPGLHALWPVIGAGLIVYAGAQAPLMRLALSNSGALWIGRISYSLYLWHWPLIAFAYYRLGPDFDISVKLGILITSILLAWLSYRFIEQPLRNRAFLRRARVFLLAAAGSLVLILAASMIDLSSGFDRRLDDRVKAMAQGEFDINPRRDACHSYRDFTADFPAGCLMGDLNQESLRAVLWGDSHADAIAPGVDEMLVRAQIKGVQMTKNSCPPLPGFALDAKFMTQQECLTFNDDVLAYIEARPDIEYVILSSRWITSAESGNLLQELVSRLKQAGKTPLIIGQSPAFDFAVPQCLAKQAWFDDPEHFACQPRTRAQFDEDFASVRKMLRPIHDSGAAPVFFPEDILCPADWERCLMLDEDGRPLYFDNNHLSAAGAKFLVPAMTDTFHLN